MPGHSSSPVPQPAQSSPGPQRSLLSPAPVEQGQVENLDLPSILETFKAVRDLIALMDPHTPDQHERSIILGCSGGFFVCSLVPRHASFGRLQALCFMQQGQTCHLLSWRLVLTPPVRGVVLATPPGISTVHGPRHRSTIKFMLRRSQWPFWNPQWFPPVSRAIRCPGKGRRHCPIRLRTHL